MELAFKHPITHLLPIRAGIESDIGLYIRDAGLILFFLLFGISLFLYSAKHIIFVRLVYFTNLIVFLFEQTGACKLKAGFYRSIKLLRHTRAEMSSRFGRLQQMASEAG